MKLFEYIEEKGSGTPAEISEEFHLEGVQQTVRKIYSKLKSSALSVDSDFVFNPQKYYISIRSNKNICFIQVRKKKIRFIVMLPEQYIRDNIKHHSVHSLSDGVQGFYNGPCAAIDIDGLNNFKEIKEIIKQSNLSAKNSQTD